MAAVQLPGREGARNVCCYGGGLGVAAERNHGEYNVKPFDVTVYGDDSHSWGRVMYQQDFTVFVKDGVVDLPKHMIRGDVRYDVEDALSDIIAAVEACVLAFQSGRE